MAEETTNAGGASATAEAPTAPTGPKPTYIWGVGRRKSAVARVRIAPGNGRIEINGKTLNDYFTNERDRKAIFGPLEVTSTGGKMDVLVNADGGGPTGQAGAIVLGLGRALAKYDQGLEGAPPRRRVHDPRQPHEGA
jgi:small subunit ribosomal protein S9